MPQCCQNAARIMPECCQNAARMMPECCQNAARMLPECCQNAARMLPEWCQNAARMLPELWLPKGLRMCNCQQKQPRRLEPPAANEGDRATGRVLKVCNCKQKQGFEQKAAWWHCEKVNSFRARRSTTKDWFCGLTLLRGENADSWWSMDMDILKSWFLWRENAYL